MTDYVVTGVRKTLSADATHRHISDVVTQGAIRHTRQEVIDSIRQGDNWRALADGHKAEIRIVDACPHARCVLSPYIATNPDSSGKDNLENLNAY